MIPEPAPRTDGQEHSVYSPSGSKRWLQCPASIQMCADIPVQESYNFAAEEGTAAHELASHCLENEIDNARDCIGMEFNEFKIDASFAKGVNVYLDYVNGQVTWDSQMLVESQFSLEFIEPGMFGTADCAIFDITDNVLIDLEVADLKYGRGVLVEATDNTQLAIYAIGCIKHILSQGVEVPDDLEVKLTIVQPRAPHPDGPIRHAFMTVAQLKDLTRYIRRRIELSKEEVPPFGPSEDACRWCEARAICQAHARYNIEAMQTDFAEFMAPENGQSLLEARSLTEDQLRLVLERSKMIQHWLKSVAEYATELMAAGTPVPGFKLVYGRSIRRWSNSDEALRILLEEGVPEDQLFTKKFLTAPQADKQLEDWAWEKISHLVEKPLGKVTLAPESSSSPAINPDQEAQKEWAD